MTEEEIIAAAIDAAYAAYDKVLDAVGHGGTIDSTTYAAWQASYDEARIAVTEEDARKAWQGVSDAGRKAFHATATAASANNDVACAAALKAWRAAVNKENRND